MSCQFLEIYNETLRDLIGEDDGINRKCEIKHDNVTCKTTVTEATTGTFLII